MFQNQKYKKPFWSTFRALCAQKWSFDFGTYQLILPPPLTLKLKKKLKVKDGYKKGAFQYSFQNSFTLRKW
jgi:hypothetical protein